MNKQEVVAILKVLKANYPRFYNDTTKEEAEEIVNLWSMMLANDNSRNVMEAVKVLINSLKYPPTIADIREKLNLITKVEDELTEGEAWHLVFKALSNCNYNAVDEFKKLPSIIQKIVGSPNQLREWAMMETDTVNSVIQSNFMRSYKVKVKEKIEYDMLPESTKQLRLELQEKFKMLGGGNNFNNNLS